MFLTFPYIEQAISVIDVLQVASAFAPSYHSHSIHDCDNDACDCSHKCSDQHQAHGYIHRSITGVRRPVSMGAQRQHPAQQ
jgi:hypothetical protein